MDAVPATTGLRRLIRRPSDSEPKSRRDTALVFFFGLLLYGVAITHPDVAVIDEAIYCHVAVELTDQPFYGGEYPPLPQNYEHPPLGKLWMWASTSAFGFGQFGCRLPSVIAGASVGATLFVAGTRLFGSRQAGLIAASCWFLDTMAYFGATIGMLDVPAVAFVIGAYAVALRPQLNTLSRALSAILFGLGVATKLSALFAAPFLVYLLVRADGAPDLRRRVRAVAKTGLIMIGAFQATYLPYLAGWWKLFGPAEVLPKLQSTWYWMFAYHSGSGTFVGVNAGPARWIIQGRPLWGEVEYLSDGTLAVAATVGNQALWWLVWGTMLVILTNIAYRVLRKEPIRILEGTHLSTFLVASTMLVAATLPYFLLSRRLYQFYVIGFLPFMDLVATACLLFVLRTPKVRPYRYGLIAIVGLVFLLRFPFVEGIPVPAWYARALLPGLPE